MSRRDEIGGAKHQPQDGQTANAIVFMGILSSMSAEWRWFLLLRQPLRASADEWERGRRMGTLALKRFTPHAALARASPRPLRQKKPQASRGLS